MVTESDELKITHIYSAPREKVFEAWTNPNIVEQWWGCAETTSVKSRIDLRIGGKFSHTMQVEGFGEINYHGFYTEIVPPETLAYDVVMGLDDSNSVSNVRVEFFDEDGKTRLVLTQRGFPSLEMFKPIAAGYKAALGKLDALLSEHCSKEVSS